MTGSLDLRRAMPILIGAAIVLTSSMGIRRCFGLFIQTLTKDRAVSVPDFTLALSIQNLAWGFCNHSPGRAPQFTE
jgi:multisubunit Na+/H+ antiporter MnhG subunit